jgi:hypothetical protein
MSPGCGFATDSTIPGNRRPVAVPLEFPAAPTPGFPALEGTIVSGVLRCSNRKGCVSRCPGGFDCGVAASFAAGLEGVLVLLALAEESR